MSLYARSPEPRRGGGGGGGGFSSSGSSGSGSSTNRCAEVDAFQHNSQQVAYLSIEAIFLFLFSVLLWYAATTPNRIRKKELASGPGMSVRRTLPWWWLFLCALGLQIMAMIVRIISICLQECLIIQPTFYDGGIAAINGMAIGIQWANYTATVAIFFFVAFPVVNRVRAACKYTQRLMSPSNSLRGFFFTMVFILYIVIMGINTYVISEYSQYTVSQDIDALDRLEKLDYDVVKLGIAWDAFLLLLAITTAVTMVFAIRKVRNSGMITWIMILLGFFVLMPFYWFVTDLYFYKHNHHILSKAVGPALSALTFVLLFGLCLSAMFTHIAAARVYRSHQGVDESKPAVPANYGYYPQQAPVATAQAQHHQVPQGQNYYVPQPARQQDQEAVKY